MRSILSAVIVALLIGPSFASGQTSDPARVYDSLVSRVRGGDTLVDFGAMRMAFAESPKFDPYDIDQMTAEGMMLKAYKADSLGRVLELANGLLERNYANMQAHHMLSVVYAQRGDVGRSKLHHAVVSGLVRAMAASGDGRTPETAWKVISVREEYFFVMVLGLEVQKQTLVSAADGSPADKLDVKEAKSGEKRQIYFNVNIPMSVLARSMKE